MIQVDVGIFYTAKDFYDGELVYLAGYYYVNASELEGPYSTLVDVREAFDQFQRAMVNPLQKELDGMRRGNRTLFLKVENLKRQLESLYDTVRAWKARHQEKYDLAEALFHERYNLYRHSAERYDTPSDIPSFQEYRRDWLKAHGFYTEKTHD